MFWARGPQNSLLPKIFPADPEVLGSWVGILPIQLGSNWPRHGRYRAQQISNPFTWRATSSALEVGEGCRQVCYIFYAIPAPPPHEDTKRAKTCSLLGCAVSAEMEAHKQCVEADVTALPFDALLSVLTHLSVQDVANLSLVHPEWRRHLIETR